MCSQTFSVKCRSSSADKTIRDRTMPLASIEQRDFVSSCLLSNTQCSTLSSHSLDSPSLCTKHTFLSITAHCHPGVVNPFTWLIGVHSWCLIFLLNGAALIAFWLFKYLPCRWVRVSLFLCVYAYLYYMHVCANAGILGKSYSFRGPLLYSAAPCLSQ